MIWIDCIKIFACVFVVLGHLYMSMMETGLISKTSVYYCVPIQTVYTFHVQLFFVCSGFLYQKFKKNTSVKGHFRNAGNKAIALGVPFFVFSLITIAMKTLFAGAVNSNATPILESLFIKPISPYWYLYILFILFLIIPAVKDSRKLWIIFLTAVAVKIAYVFTPINLPYVIAQLASCAIWFVFGMVLTIICFKYCVIEKIMCILLGCSGVVLSIYFFREINHSRTINFCISILFVLFFVYLFIWITKNGRLSKSYILRKYVLPVFLMHTIFAAGARSVLTKIGINSLGIHLVVGIIVSFLFPILVYKIAERKWYLLIFIEPLKAWKIRKEKE